MTANTHHTKLKGDIAVAAVILDLTKKGYIISEPMSENAPYDLICDTGDKLLRVQVKYRKNGHIPSKTTWSDKNGTHENIIDVSKIDYFALVNEDYTKICYPPSCFAGKSFNWEVPLSYQEYYLWEDYTEFLFKNYPTRTNNPEDIKDLRKVSSYTPTSKIEWPSVEEMSKLVFEKPTQQLAKDLGVSDVAVGKFCKKHNIKKPERGYWTKIVALSS